MNMASSIDLLEAAKNDKIHILAANESQTNWNYLSLQQRIKLQLHLGAIKISSTPESFHFISQWAKITSHYRYSTVHSSILPLASIDEPEHLLRDIWEPIPPSPIEQVAPLAVTCPPPLPAGVLHIPKGNRLSFVARSPCSRMETSTAPRVYLRLPRILWSWSLGRWLPLGDQSLPPGPQQRP